MKAIVLRDLKYPYTEDLQESQIVEISIKTGDLYRTDTGKLINEKDLLILKPLEITPMINIYRDVVSLMDAAELNDIQKNVIKLGLKDIFDKIKIDII